MAPFLSIIVPAKNEAATIGALVTSLRQQYAQAELLVVDDGSTDLTRAVALDAGAKVIHHPVTRGNGAAVKSGARAACGEVLVFMDADGQHDPADIPRLLRKLEQGYDLVIGCRSATGHANIFRRIANAAYNKLASVLTGSKIKDLTSGFRATRASHFREFLPLLPNGFSYPTTSTMAFLRAGYGVAFEPVDVKVREKDSQSHIRPLRDGARFLLIIFKVATLYAPLKVFTPLSGFFFLAGMTYSVYTITVLSRFTNFGALLFVTALLVFLIGLVSEQITGLLYSRSNNPS